MATSRISNTIKDPSGTAIASVPVQARLMPSAGFRISDFTEVARIESTTTDSSGFWQMDLERNSNITPSNSWYEVTELIPDASGGKRVWLIAVGDSDQSLLGSLVTPAEQQPTVVPAGTVYLDQASADARYQALGSLGSSTPVRIDPDDAGTAGVATSASRSDHEHPITTGTPASVGLTGTNAESSGTGFARDTHVHAYSPPTVRVTHNANQTVANNSIMTLAFNTETYDPTGMHDTAVNNSRITFTTPGVYLISLNATLSSDTDYTLAEAFIKLNGTTFIAASTVGTATNANDHVSFCVSAQYKVSAGDYVEALMFQINTSANVNNCLSLSYTPIFSATWIAVG